MDKDNKKLVKKKRSKSWQWLCVLFGIGLLLYPQRKKIQKKVKQPINRFALILNEECKYIPEKMASMRTRIKNYLQDFFIPSSRNDHQPHGLSTRLLKFYAVILILIKLLTVGFLFFTYPSPAVLSQKISQEIFELTNNSRKAENINELSWNTELTRAAQAKAEDMIKNNYFAHIGPDGKQPWEWINKGEYYFLYMGENLAMDFSSAKIAHSAFQQSPTHWKNIMNPKYKDMGVGVAVGKINDRDTIVLVEFFGAHKELSSIVPVAQAAVDTSVAAATTPTTNNQDILVTAPIAPVEQPVVTNTTKTAVSQEEINKQISETAFKPEEVVKQNKEENIIPESIPEPEKVNEELQAPVPQQLVAEIMIPEQVDISDQTVLVSSIDESTQKSLVEYVVIFSRYALLVFLVVLLVMLLINILVKPHIQHSKVILQTLGVILLVSTLLLTRFHFIEEIQHILIF